MQMRAFGRTGLQVSVLGFGCGAVGGLMVRGSPADQERTVARALDAGVNYFDTAPLYGDGASETNLGRVLKTLKPRDAVVATKVRLPPSEPRRIAAAIARSLEDSLARLGREAVDILHLHNPIDAPGGALSAQVVLDEVAPALESLIARGLVRIAGFTAVGDTAALGQVMDCGRFGSAQVVYNLLNPSAGAPLARGAVGQDYDRLLDRAAAGGVGVVAIRVLAGGALSGSPARHPIASPPPAPIGSAATYEADLARARAFLPLVAEGHAANLAEAATRFALSHPAVGTVLVGMATPAEFEAALAAALKGPLPQPALARAAELAAVP